MEAESKEMQEYFKSIQSEMRRIYGIASEARKKGFDPEDKVDIHLAESMADRVEGLISAVAPQLVGSGVTKRITALEKKYGILSWQVALIIADEVAKEKFCKFSSQKEAMEIGIRTGFAYHTLGIVSAPLEGFIELDIKKTKGGKDYFAVKYAGPIRGAGGTAAAVSVIIADYVRKRMGFGVYDPSEEEINRFITELNDYHERVTNLQYRPSDEEIRILVKGIPVEIDGDPTEIFEVSNYKDLSRVHTNRIRSGVCLVLSMIALKAPKLWKRLKEWGTEFDLEWGFLKDFLVVQKRAKAKEETDSVKVTKVTPNHTYINDLVAGRPVLTHPLRPGGFRLRYGRTRISGFSAAAIHPATMALLNRYIATGTQLKVERPGKAAAITPCDSIEGPVVKLRNGSVIKIHSKNEVKAILPDVEEILYLGDILFNYGDFSENNHFLVPSGFCEEEWALGLEKAAVNLFGAIDYDKLSEFVGISREKLEAMITFPFNPKLSARAAISISLKLEIPLHPEYTYHWGRLSGKEIRELLVAVGKANLKRDAEGNLERVIVRAHPGIKRSFELIGIPHVLASNEFVVFDRNHGAALLVSLAADEKGFEKKGDMIADSEDGLSSISKLARLKIRDKSGTFIGARMGRPEKAKMRKLTGSPHVLFPVGSEGGRLRSIQATMEQGKVRSDFPIFYCRKCDSRTVFGVCDQCGKQTKQQFYCEVCGFIDTKQCAKHGSTKTFLKQDVDINRLFSNILKKTGTRTYPDLIKGVKGTSNKDHIPEHLMKGILRAKHGVYVNKDGTTRYDMSELPITHFVPREVGVSVGRLLKLGYFHDVNGAPLKSDDQLLEIKPQDVILPGTDFSIDESAKKVLFKTAAFIDELLVKLYGMEPIYNLVSEEDLIGILVVGLAPHISAGMIGRIIGFSRTQACFAHPLWHAALRRDCDGDEACVILLADALLNFSSKYLPDKRGSRTMDAPLVLTSKLIPSEVDDMALGMDVVWKYPLEFYSSARNYSLPREVNIAVIGKFLGTPKQYESLGFTHPVSSINQGVNCSAYKTLPSMEDKLRGQMELAERISAVDESDVARLVIEKHFLKDTKGNLRKFFMQEFRCVSCNEKFRRPPLSGVCSKCRGKIIFTVSEGSVIKYLGPSISLAAKYNLPKYISQSIDLTKRRIEEVFGKDKDRQEGLGRWFG